LGKNQNKSRHKQKTTQILLPRSGILVIGEHDAPPWV
jgi:hypothetical protein